MIKKGKKGYLLLISIALDNILQLKFFIRLQDTNVQTTTYSFHIIDLYELTCT